MDLPEKVETVKEDKAAESEGTPLQISTEEIHATEEFQQRMEDLKSSIAYSSENRIRALSVRIRQSSWSLGAIIFLAILITRWDSQDPEPPGPYFTAVLALVIVVCLAELVIAVLRRRR